MAFTYNEDLSDAVSQVRFQIGDTLENNGPRPNNRNFSDEELSAVMTLQSSDVPKSIASMFGVLASEWSKYSVSFTVGPRSEDLSGIVERYTQLRDQWAKTSGLGSRNFSSGLIRAGSGANTEFTA